jgi:GT2 family glycosyltransferase
MPTIACILVNWNNWQDTADCLASLARQDYQALHVLVVDNGSTNDSVARLRTLHPWATILEAGANLGFPKACNLGAAHAPTADLLWFLNNDTVVPADTLFKLVVTAQAHPRAGIVGARLFYAHNPTQLQAWGGGHISRWTAYNTHFTAPHTFGPGDYITFASALVRRSCFDQLGGLFEGVFMYFEDVDFSLRAATAGWQLVVAPDTAILHKEGGSTKGRNLKLEAIITSSALTFLQRHAPIPVIAHALFLTLRLARRAVKRDWPGLRAVLAGARPRPRGAP